MRKRKICYVVTLPSTIEAFFIPQLQYLSEKEYDVTVVCSSSNTLQEKLGKKIRYIPCDIPRGLSVFQSCIAIRLLIKIFREKMAVEFPELCYVEDNIKKDYIAPENLGMRSIWFRNKDGLYC